MSAAPAPPGPSAPPPRAQPNTAIFWILGIIAGGILVLVLGGLSLAAFIIHRIHVTQNAEHVEIETPVGGIKVGQDQPGSTGLPVYPGATIRKSDGASFEITANDTHAGLVIVKYHSPDSRDVVRDWYAKRLGPSFKIKSGNYNSDKNDLGIPDVDLKTGDVAFESKNNGNNTRVVAIQEMDGGSDIVLIRVGKSEPQ